MVASDVSQFPWRIHLEFRLRLGLNRYDVLHALYVVLMVEVRNVQVVCEVFDFRIFGVAYIHTLQLPAPRSPFNSF